MNLLNVVNKNHCEPPLQAIESKGELASNGLKLSLFTKGLRLSVYVQLVGFFKFKTFPVYEGIKTEIAIQAGTNMMFKTFPVYEGIKTPE